MQQFILTTENIKELQEVFIQGVREELKNILKSTNPLKKEEEYLTRKEVKELLKIEYTTLSRWSESGKLKSYGIGSRVYYKRSEIDNCLIPLKEQ